MTIAPSPMTVRGRRFDWGSRTYLMGVVNLSPDSFSGDGVASLQDAVARAERLAADGADIIDVGGMSTRPAVRGRDASGAGFEELTVEEERDRVVPAIEAIVRALDLPVSIDSYRAPVIAAALEAGAHIVNDIDGLRGDPAIAPLVARWGVPAVVMHNQRGRVFHETIADLRAGFEAALSLAGEAGIDPAQLILDPGFGFGWAVEHNLEMLRRLRELRVFGRPLLVGTSRKSTIGAVLDLPPEQRLWGTAATVAVSIANGADIIRVHDVAELRQVARMTDAIVRPGR